MAKTATLKTKTGEKLRPAKSGKGLERVHTYDASKTRKIRKSKTQKATTPARAATVPPRKAARGR